MTPEQLDRADAFTRTLVQDPELRESLKPLVVAAIDEGFREGFATGLATQASRENGLALLIGLLVGFFGGVYGAPLLR